MEINIEETYGQLNQRVTPCMEESRLFYDGDHWQAGKGLTVKKPTDQTTLSKMEEDFTSENIISEIVDRRRDGILGREPNWSLLPKTQKEPTEAQIKSIDEMVSAIVEWWNNRNGLELMRESFVNACLDRRNELRPFVARAFKDQNGNIQPQKSLAEALELLHFENVSPKDAGVFLEPNSLKPYSIFKTVREDKTEIDFSFVDADGVTHFKTFTESAFDDFLKREFPTSLAKYIVVKTGDKKVSETSIDLGGKLALFEMDLGRPFVTKSIKSKQKQINLNLTMQGRNGYTAGFRERHFLNADEPDDLKLGAGTATYHQGTPVRNDNGEIIGLADPSVMVVDPVAPTTFIESEDSLYVQILNEAEQRHVAMNDSATASGRSRTEARGEFRNSLTNIKSQVDAEGRYIIEFAMMFAAALTGRTKEFEQFRCDFNSIVNAGVLSPEEKDDNRKAYQAGEISLETLMSRNGSEDTDAEMNRIKAEDGYEINFLQKAGDVYTAFGGAIEVKAIINLLPFDEEKKNLLLGAVKDPVVTE